MIDIHVNHMLNYTQHACKPPSGTGKDEGMESKEYAVSDETGDYVFYTDSYSEALEMMKEIDNNLDEEDEEDEGSAAIMRRVEGTGGYELYY